MKTVKNKTPKENRFFERVCPHCGKPKSAWKGNYGQGYIQQGETYCCEGCAEEIECGCGNEETETTGEERRP